jgi:hypothetical protein
LQWQAAHAAVVPPEQQMSNMAGHCPAHLSKDSRSDKGHRAGTSTSAPSPHNDPAGKHDCCSSLGCDCHCAQSPGVLDLPLARATLSSSLLLPAFDARPPVARTTEFFRPPIA